MTWTKHPGMFNDVAEHHWTRPGGCPDGHPGALEVRWCDIVERWEARFRGCTGSAAKPRAALVALKELAMTRHHETGTPPWQTIADEARLALSRWPEHQEFP